MRNALLESRRKHPHHLATETAKSSPAVMWKAEVMSDEHTYIAREDFKLSDESTIFFLPLVYA